MLTLERRRAERSRKPFVLMLLDSQRGAEKWERCDVHRQLTSVVCDATRETDLVGWYEEGAILAVIFTEISLEGKNPITEVLHSKVVAALRENLDHRLASKLVVTLHLFPGELGQGAAGSRGRHQAVSGNFPKEFTKRLPMIVKRAIDIAGSGALLLVALADSGGDRLAIKLTSKGPVIFEQDRLGQFGKRFKCLKFRTMYHEQRSEDSS